jgi:ribosomal protein S18 acetylase RimI-like enzyme
MTTITSRAFLTEDDYFKVHRFLSDTYPITPLGLNWEIRHWEGQRYHNDPPTSPAAWSETIRLWETSDGDLVGVAHGEGPGDAALDVHPNYSYLRDEMLTWAEQHLTKEDNQKHELEVFVWDYDTEFQQIVARHGFSKLPHSWKAWRLHFDQLDTLPTPVVAEGYTMRHLCDPGDYQRIADVVNAGFNRGDFHKGIDIKVFAQNAPSFRPELHLLAIASDGTTVSHVGITLDKRTGHGIFEPICTHPAHTRKGLAQAMMFEGLHRLKALGAVDVEVQTGDAGPANALYDSIGFTEKVKGWYWRKTSE